VTMKVLIMSDSHGLTHEISMIADRHKQEVAAMIHCGDSELERNDPHMSEFLAVAGIATMIRHIRMILWRISQASVSS